MRVVARPCSGQQYLPELFVGRPKQHQQNIALTRQITQPPGQEALASGCFARDLGLLRPRSQDANSNPIAGRRARSQAIDAHHVAPLHVRVEELGRYYTLFKIDVAVLAALIG